MRLGEAVAGVVWPQVPVLVTRAFRVFEGHGGEQVPRWRPGICAGPRSGPRRRDRLDSRPWCLGYVLVDHGHDRVGVPDDEAGGGPGRETLPGGVHGPRSEEPESRPLGRGRGDVLDACPGRGCRDAETVDADLVRRDPLGVQPVERDPPEPQPVRPAQGGGTVRSRDEPADLADHYGAVPPGDEVSDVLAGAVPPGFADLEAVLTEVG